MSLFQDKILNKAIGKKALTIPQSHMIIITNWKERIENNSLKKQSEVSIYPAFIQNIMVGLLGYIIYGSCREWTLNHEQGTGSGSVDIAIGKFCDDLEKCQVIAPFEIKGAKTHNLDAIMPGRHKSPVDQAWEYANDTRDAQWVLVSNYVEIRLYAVKETRKIYEKFYFVDLVKPEIYARFIRLFSAKNLLTGKTAKLLDQSLLADKDITARLYADYKSLREKLIANLIKENPRKKPVNLIPPAQKLLDRFLFLVFAEDKGLIPMNSVQNAFTHKDPYNPHPTYENFKGLFTAVDKGNRELSIPSYNGGLFAQDDELDALKLTDEVCECVNELAKYDFDSEVSVTVLGHIFEQSISDLENLVSKIKEGKQATSADTEVKNKRAVKGKRKRQGVVYTPDHITHFIVERTLGSYIEKLFDNLLIDYGKFTKDGTIQWKRGKKTELKFWQAWQKILEGIKIVDPACGSGAFLVEAFTFLHDQYKKANDKLAELSGGQYSLFDLNKEILTNNLFGADINPESVEITKLSLWLKTAEKGKTLTSLGKNIVSGNSLGLGKKVPGDAFSWKKVFPEIMEQGGFDVVLGNPPYVRQERISDIKPWLEKNFEVYHGVADLYTYFFELGHKLLKPGGRMGYISSSTFFKTGSGQSLRKYISEKTSLKEIVDFGDIQVFEGVTTYPAIIIAENTPPSHDDSFKILSLKDSLPLNLKQYFTQNHGNMDQLQLDETSWQLEDRKMSDLRKKLTEGHKTLKEIYGSPYRGILTGLNAAFVVDGFTRKKLIEEDPISHELLKPFLEGKDLKKWHAQPRDLWLIFTRRGTKIEDYPAIKNHLEKLREQLEPKPRTWPKGHKWPGRKTGNYKWFEIQDTIAYYKEFEGEKIFYPEFSVSSKFHLDVKSFYSNNKGFIQPNGGHFLLGILNSSTIWTFLKGICTSVRGGYLELRSIKIETTPIPDTSKAQKDSIESLVKKCQKLSKERYTIEHNFRRLLPSLCPENRVPKLNKKMQQWWLLDFPQLQKEIKKQFKSEIPLVKQIEWQDLFEKNKETIDDYNRQIALHEKDINSEVYKLFNLTEDEIVLIENNV